MAKQHKGGWSRRIACQEAKPELTLSDNRDIIFISWGSMPGQGTHRRDKTKEQT